IDRPGDGVRSLLLGLAPLGQYGTVDDQDRAVGAPYDRTCDTADQPLPHAPRAAGREDNEIGAGALGVGEDLVGRVADDDLCGAEFLGYTRGLEALPEPAGRVTDEFGL